MEKRHSYGLCRLIGAQQQSNSRRILYFRLLQMRSIQLTASDRLTLYKSVLESSSNMSHAFLTLLLPVPVVHLQKCCWYLHYDIETMHYRLTIKLFCIWFRHFLCQTRSLTLWISWWPSIHFSDYDKRRKDINAFWHTFELETTN